MSERRPGFSVDEQPLRDFVLKAYHETRSGSEKSRRAMDAIRQFLSGPPGGETVPGSYWFEKDPEASIRSFLIDLDLADTSFVASVFQPLLAAAVDVERKDKKTLAANLPVYVSSLSGSCAVKTQVDETTASAVVSAAIIGLARLGKEPFEKVLTSHSG